VDEWTAHGGQATIMAGRQHTGQRPEGGTTHKDVKNEGRSGNVYENKGRHNTMTDDYSGFCAWSAPFLQKLTKIQRAFWPKTHKSNGNWGEAGTRIGSSVHRVIDPSPQHGVTLRWPDDPMIRCFNHLAFPLCDSKQKMLARNSKNPAKCHVIEKKTVTSFVMARVAKNAGGKI